MNDKFIILYRYHKDFEIVINRINLIKHIDPAIRVFGIYGGDLDFFDESTRYLKNHLEDNYLIKNADARWKWLHADIAYKMWFEDVGKHVDFEYASVLEWDLLYLEKISNLFCNISPKSVHLSGIIEESKIDNYWYWSRSIHEKKRNDFFEKIRVHYGKPVKTYAILGPGLCMPKEFLEGLSSIKLFEADLSDEIKIPVWAQLLGFDMVSNNFYRNWFSFYELKYFNSNVVDIQFEIIKKEMEKGDGRRAFHPYRGSDDLDTLIELYENAVLRFGHYINNKTLPVKVINPMLYKVHCKMADWKYGLNNLP